MKKEERLKSMGVTTLPLVIARERLGQSSLRTLLPETLALGDCRASLRHARKDERGRLARGRGPCGFPNPLPVTKAPLNKGGWGDLLLLAAYS